MAADKRIVVHHVTGRLKGMRRIIGHTVVEAAPPTLEVENGEMSLAVVNLVLEQDRYVLYREFNTPSLLAKEQE